MDIETWQHCGIETVHSVPRIFQSVARFLSVFEQATPPHSRPLTPTPSMASGLNMIIDSRDGDDVNMKEKLAERTSNRFLVTPLKHQNEADEETEGEELNKTQG